MDAIERLIWEEKKQAMFEEESIGDSLFDMNELQESLQDTDVYE